MAFRSIGASTGYASRTNTTLAAPAGIVDGDTLLLICSTEEAGSGEAMTLPAGFTALAGYPVSITYAAVTVKLTIAYKVAASESGSYTVTHGAVSSGSDGVVLAISGGSGGVPVATVANGLGQTSTATGLTTVSNALVMFVSRAWEFYGAASPPTGTTPTFTERQDLGTSVTYVATGAVTAGATGNKAHTNSNLGSTLWIAGLVIVP